MDPSEKAIEGAKFVFDELLPEIGPQPDIKITVEGDNIKVDGDLEALVEWQEKLYEGFKRHDWSWLLP